MTPHLFKNVLLVEDEKYLADTLLIALKRMGIQALHVSTLTAARKKTALQEPDLMILDRNLPDGDGISLCQEMRIKGSTTAILMLTAAGETEDRVHGLNAGADDYLPKPFSWEELVARITALGRRSGSIGKTGNKTWDLDESKLRIRGPGGWVELTPLEFKLASHLMLAKGAIVGREKLLKEVWGFTLLPKTRTVDHFLGRLRKLFEADPENPKYFITVRGAGYKFEEGPFSDSQKVTKFQP